MINAVKKLAMDVQEDLLSHYGKEIFCALGTGATYPYLKSIEAPNVVTTITDAKAMAVTGRNDAIYLSPDSHPQAAKITWALNNSHLIGQYGPGMMNQRSRIGVSAAFNTMIDVTGYGNTFQNLYWMYGGTTAATLNLLSAGMRNNFIRNHFLVSGDTALDEAAFKLVDLNGSECYFKGCVFGQDGVAWTGAGAMLNFGAQADVPRSIFEDCVFLMYADAAAPFFIKTVAGLGRGAAIFRNCQFINLGTSLTYAIDGTGLNNFRLYFDNRCFFAGVDDVVALAYESYVMTGAAATVINQVTGGASVALFNLMTAKPDVS